MPPYEQPEYRPTEHDQSTRTAYLESKVNFLLNEVSALRSLVRHLVSDNIHLMPLTDQTKESFNFQWDEVSQGNAMLSDEPWKKGVTDTISEFADLPKGWFKGKDVVDAGCGLGRWTYGFGKLGVGSCYSFDISKAGIARTTAVAAEFGKNFNVERRNILEPIDLGKTFDLVWCFGVLHHTGNTFKGFQNLVRLVKPGGYLFLMLYGEPRPNDMGDYNYYHEMFEMRMKLRTVPFREKVALIKQKYGEKLFHGYFDAISPEINDLYRWEEIVLWLRNAGFEEIKRTLAGHPNHHVVARKRAEN